MTAPEQRVDQIFALDDRIRYVALLDSHYKVLQSKMRTGVQSLTGAEKDRKFMGSAAPIIVDILSQLERECGILHLVTATYQRISLILFRWGSQVAVLSVEPDSIEQILQLIRTGLGIRFSM